MEVRVTLRGWSFHKIDNKCGDPTAFHRVEYITGRSLVTFRDRMYAPCWKCFPYGKVSEE